MTKTQALEILRESMRQARIERDSGNESAHGKVMFFLQAINILTRLKGEAAKAWIAARSFN